MVAQLTGTLKNLFEEFRVTNAQFDMTDSTLDFEVVVPTER